MLAVMKGGGSRWHIFRGQETRDFLNGLVLIAEWPVSVNPQGHGREVGKLFLTDHSACVLVLNNDTVPDVVAKAIFTRAVVLAEESERKKSALN